jgi:hypothetical protein
MDRIATEPQNGIAKLAAAEDFVRFFSEGWAKPKPEGFLAHFKPRIHPEARFVQPTLPPARGPAEFEKGFRELFASLPDYMVEVDDWAARGDAVFIWVTHSATIGRRRRSWQGCDRIVLEDGLIRERVAVLDSGEVMPAVVAVPRLWPQLARWTLATARARRA